MCDFFSFVGDGYGNYLYSDWQQRKTDLSKNWDSHTKILTDNKISVEKQDRWSKYEYNPITKEFVIDEPFEGHDHEAAENWVNALGFKSICEPLIIKKIKNPLKGNTKKVTEKEIDFLKKWASVGDSVIDSVWVSVGDSVGVSVGASIWASVRASVGDSVRASVGASVWDSVIDSVWVYYSSFFDIEYKFDFSSCIRLWESGFVPSFDRKIWRLHSGKKAEVVYEWSKK